MLDLNTPIEQLTSIGKKIAPKLKKLELYTAQDLLFYFPFRWEDWSQIKKIQNLEPNTTTTIQGKIELIQNKRSKWKKKLITESIIADDTGQIKSIWFNSPYLLQNLKPGDEIFLSGKIDYSRQEGLQFIHPNYEKITRGKNQTTHTARLVPIYSLTKNLTQKQLRYLISQTIKLTPQINDWLPPEIIQANQLISLPLAIKQIHFPDDKNFLNQALDRLKFNELFLIQLYAQLTRCEIAKLKAIQLKFHETETKTFVDSLPFKLTDAQRKAAWEILLDLQKNTPMNRLLEGDVGSGKTIVACLAILNSQANQAQTALMVPTEILAKQHFESISKLFAAWDVKIGLLTNSLQATNFSTQSITKTKIHKLITTGELDLIIGTHSLIQDKVIFNNLGLIILDEQHRFGVSQRQKLKNKNLQSKIKNQKSPIPHLLSMTATPIPRSLALTVYGDLDLSIIDQMPKGRKKIITKIIPPEHRPSIYQFVAEQIQQGRQVFIICPLIDPSDKLGVKAVKDEYKKLDQEIFPDIPIGLLHGQLKSQAKEKVMSDFLKNKTKILVSTPVIEVGIDVPNASLMLIESAERFGLSQLHQFRGRVGRGQHQSYCLLFTESENMETIKRLQTLAESSNGFELAERDLEFRGPGEIYGVKQSGFNDRLKVAKLTDYLIIRQTKKAVDQLLTLDPKLTQHPSLKQQLDKFHQSIHLE